jgi:hypothetical protein
MRERVIIILMVWIYLCSYKDSIYFIKVQSPNVRRSKSFLDFFYSSAGVKLNFFQHYLWLTFFFFFWGGGGGGGGG